MPDIQQGQQTALGSPVIPAGKQEYAIKTDLPDFERENDFQNFFRKVQGGTCRTHSSLIGAFDHRIPKSGLLDINTKEKLQKLNAAIAFYYSKNAPLMLCEMATARFYFFEDVDLLLPANIKEGEVKKLEAEWVMELLKYRSAVLAAVWRCNDPIGSKPFGEGETPPTVHVFSSSGFASKHGCMKISIHFIWPDLVATPREARFIRQKTIDYLNFKCRKDPNNPLMRLLKKSSPKDAKSCTSAAFDSDAASPWETIFDKAATEGTSLRLAYCDKGTRQAGMEGGGRAKQENRVKVPVGSYEVPLVPGKPEECTPQLTHAPDGRTPEEWLAVSSIRICEQVDPEVHTKIPSNIWMSSKSNSGMSEMRYLPAQIPLPTKPLQQNPFELCAANLVGFWADTSGERYLVGHPELNKAERLPVFYEGAAAGHILLQHVFDTPVRMSYIPPTGKPMKAEFKLGRTHALLFEGTTSSTELTLRRVATAIKDSQDVAEVAEQQVYGGGPAKPISITTDLTVKAPFPEWADTILIEVAGAASEADQCLSMAALIAVCDSKVLNVQEGVYKYEPYWKGHFTITSEDIIEEGDNAGASVNVAIASLAAACFGCIALQDLKPQIKESKAKISQIILASDHTVVESARDGKDKKYMSDLTKCLQENIVAITQSETFKDVINITNSKLPAKENKASKLAKEAKARCFDEAIVASSMYDFELYAALLTACREAAKHTGKEKEEKKKK